MRPHKRDLQFGVGFLHFGDQLDVAGEAGRGGKEHQEVVLLAQFNGLLGRHMERRCEYRSLSVQVAPPADTWCGGAPGRVTPATIPAGSASHTGYQYDSISR